MPIRVLRLIEYTYETPERMSDDMSKWTTTLHVAGMSLRSAVLDPRWEADDGTDT